MCVTVKMTSSVPVNVVSVTNPSPTGSTATTIRLPKEENIYRMMQSFPKHDTVRLKFDNFVQW